MEQKPPQLALCQRLSVVGSRVYCDALREQEERQDNEQAYLVRISSVPGVFRHSHFLDGIVVGKGWNWWTRLCAHVEKVCCF